jgi:hypothetical protein
VILPALWITHFIQTVWTKRQDNTVDLDRKVAESSQRPPPPQEDVRGLQREMSKNFGNEENYVHK